MRKGACRWGRNHCPQLVELGDECCIRFITGLPDAKLFIGRCEYCRPTYLCDTQGAKEEWNPAENPTVKLNRTLKVHESSKEETHPRANEG